MIIEEGKFYRTRAGEKIGPVKFGGTKDQLGYFATAPGFSHDNWYTQRNPDHGDKSGRTSILQESEMDLIAEWIEEPAVFRTPTDRRIDLAVAVPLSDDVLRLSLTVGGKTEQFTISRGAAASLAGRIAEALK